MKTDELREMYLAFFESKGHTRRDSDVMVPRWDPSVLFTPAGMNQFKDHFLGKVKLDFTRATTCQKCLRTGDIDNVGRTAYHHTFFEMLGNFSFGDYFKREAILWAWEFLTDKSWLNLDAGRLTISVYRDDDQAAAIWTDEVGLPSGRVQRMGEHDNFWPAGAPSEGPDGVCGPCSEIFYQDDFGDEVEIWNLVFTQFNRVGDPPDNLRPLPSQNIDTGMGLERTAAVLQGVRTNFHIDILQPIVDSAADLFETAYDFDSENGRRLRRITDHVRACVMAIHENVYPGPQAEKYVIRRLLRRAVLDGHQMGKREPFLHQLVPKVVEMMVPAYPDLNQSVQRVAGVIESEESNFLGTLDAGLDRLSRIFETMAKENRTNVDGGEAADLYQTYGLPPEVFEQMAAENNLAFDWEGYSNAMAEHGAKSNRRVHTVMGGGGPIDAIKKVLHKVEFLGYETTEAETEVKFIVSHGQLCEHLQCGGDESLTVVVLDRTPFYGESGGQVGDAGEIETDDAVFEVKDTQRDGDLVLHYGHMRTGELRTGAAARAKVDATRRDGIRRAHSATHVLHHALREQLGEDAQQRGSKVDEDWLRFDFNHGKAVTAEQLREIERLANERIKSNAAIKAEILPLADAREAGAMMLFGEKYPDPARMVSMGDFSHELCGGTHLDETGAIGSLDITMEEGVAASTRRITALTGDRAEANGKQTQSALRGIATLLEVSPHHALAGVRDLQATIRSLKKQLDTGAKQEPVEWTASGAPDAEIDYVEAKQALRDVARLLNVKPFDAPARVEGMLDEVKQLKEQLSNAADSGELSAESLLESAETYGGKSVIVADVPGANPNRMRQLVDQIRKKTDSAAVLLAAAQGPKVILVAGLSKDLVGRGASAGEWVRQVAPVVGGGGGGKPDMAQAGGKQPDKIPDALEQARKVIRTMLD